MTLLLTYFLSSKPCPHRKHFAAMWWPEQENHIQQVQVNTVEITADRTQYEVTEVTASEQRRLLTDIWASGKYITGLPRQLKPGMLQETKSQLQSDERWDMTSCVDSALVNIILFVISVVSFTWYWILHDMKLWSH